MEQLFISALETDELPFASAVILTVAIASLIIRVARSALRFHADFIRLKRAKDIDYALESLQPSTSEHALVVESKAQEATFIALGTRLSKIERETVLGWLQHSPISIDLIRKSWSQITWRNGKIVPEMSKLDTIYLFYSLVVLALLATLGSINFLAFFTSIFIEGKVELISIPLGYFFLCWLMYKQAEPLASARKLIGRLEQLPVEKELPKPNSK